VSPNARNAVATFPTGVPFPSILLPAASQLADAYAAEREALLRARREGVAYLVGRSALRAAPGSRWLKVRPAASVFSPCHVLGRLSCASAWVVPGLYATRLRPTCVC